VLGIHSGEAAVRHALNELGINPRSEPLGWLLNRVRSQAQKSKRPVTLYQLRSLYYG